MTKKTRIQKFEREETIRHASDPFFLLSLFILILVYPYILLWFHARDPFKLRSMLAA